MPFGRIGAAASLFIRLAVADARALRKRSLQERLAMLPIAGAPVSQPVRIHWDSHQIPFIEAESDEDLAAALGIVHSHLRLGQMELMRRLAQGRISETIGRLGLDADRLIRTFDIARAVPRIIAAMPEQTRSWLEAFARGINHVLDHAPERPREFALLDLKPEPWTIADIVTLGRLIAADVNWIVWLRLLKFRGAPGWPLLWKKLLSHDMLSFASSDGGGASEPAYILAGGALRSGSNSLAVAGARSKSGAALIANDPHLSIMLPNPWLLAGIKSPSHHAAGLMVPGIPFIAIGRNPWIAWGGASLHAASSDLVAIPEKTALTERVETIAVRGGSALTHRVRESPWGPVVSDLKAFHARNETLALRWMGHRPSDEFTAMLSVGRAKNWDEFRRAFDGYALPGLEMNYADAAGHIGRLMAATLPRRQRAEPDDIISPAANGWDAPMTASELPVDFDPAEGFLASANARPSLEGHSSGQDAGEPIIGFHFSPPDRLRRLRQLLEAQPAISVQDLMRIQRDVHLTEALVQRDRLISWLRDLRLPPGARDVLKALEGWDGNYDAHSAGALAFELLFFHLARDMVPAARRAAYDAAWGTRALIWADIVAARVSLRGPALARAVRNAARDFRAPATWGARHRLHLAHPLGIIPLIGRRYRAADLPAAGTSETLMKTAHGLTNRRHRARYGSVARHISDLSDPDANHFVLLGGQDGWFGSSTFADQVPPWREGAYVIIPLSPETARARFPHHVTLTPAARP